MPRLVSPGTGEGPAQFVPASRLPKRISTAGPRFPRRAITTGAAQVFRPLGGATEVTIKVVGLNTLIEHFDAIYNLTWEMVWSINDFTGQLVTHNAQQIVPILTGDTQRSIHHNLGTQGGETLLVEIGPTTFYSPFLEHGTARMAPRPFMVPAANMAEQGYINAMLQIAHLAEGFVGLKPPYDVDRKSAGILNAFRGQLYTVEKALGDISVFGGRGAISPVRGGILGFARALGDINSVLGGVVATRVRRRVRGQVTGRLIGVGVRSVSADTTYDSFIGGGVAHRIYQRTAGRYIGIGR